MNNYDKELIIITAIWCSSCLIMNDIIKKISSSYTNLKMRKLDYDLDEAEVLKYNVGKILPVLIINDTNGNELNRLIGERTIEEVTQFLNNN